VRIWDTSLVKHCFARYAYSMKPPPLDLKGNVPIEDQFEQNWHGWPPQVYRDGAWVPIGLAALAVAREAHIRLLEAQIERLRWLCELRSGKDGP